MSNQPTDHQANKTIQTTDIKVHRGYDFLIEFKTLVLDKHTIQIKEYVYVENWNDEYVEGQMVFYFDRLDIKQTVNKVGRPVFHHLSADIFL